MFLCDIATCLPIFCPPVKFVNRYGCHDAYVPMNPSLWISPDGSYVMLVRNVNYRKFHDYTFTLSEGVSNSIYFIQRGQSIRRLYADIPERLAVSYGIPTYRTYWTGPEDIRFVSPSTVWVTVPELSPQGQPSLFQATLEGTALTSFVALRPNSTPEKNWMPYGQQSIYALCPLTLREPSGALVVVSASTVLQGYHGSTSGVLVDGLWWFIVHDKKVHRFLRTDGVVWEVSEPFSFFRGTYIEFCCSLCFYDNAFWCAVGCNDSQAFVLSVPKDSLNVSFETLK